MKDFVKGLAISQLVPKENFDELVQKWQIDKGVTKLHAEKLLRILVLSSIFEKRTLRDAEDSYSIPKSTLDDALRNRACGFFQELCSLAIKELAAHAVNRKERQELREIIAIDSSVCHVHGSMASQFITTKMEKKIAGIKFHAAWNVEHKFIEDFRVTGYRRNDGAVGKDFQFSRGKVYTFDRAYMDLALWLKIQQSNAHFVTRLKKIGSRLKYIHDYHLGTNQEGTGVLYDGKWSPGDDAYYRCGLKPQVKIFFRHIIYRDPESKMLFDFITSDFELEAIEIANIYRKRWAVELLFRWLKGHLNIRRMGYKNMNAIKVHLAIAVFVQLLLRDNMLKSSFSGTNWDYLRSLRNSLDRLLYKRLMDIDVGASSATELISMAEISP